MMNLTIENLNEISFPKMLFTRWITMNIRCHKILVLHNVLSIFGYCLFVLTENPWVIETEIDSCIGIKHCSVNSARRKKTSTHMNLLNHFESRIIWQKKNGFYEINFRRKIRHRNSITRMFLGKNLKTSRHIKAKKKQFKFFL